MSIWFVVKENWKRTETHFPNYGGLGGDTWPLDASDSPRASEVIKRLAKAEKLASMGGFYEKVCMDARIASDYYEASIELSRNCWLLRIQGVDEQSDVDGYDVGHAFGGYSLLESEKLCEGNFSGLNEFGLFSTIRSAEAFLSNRDGEDLEDAGALLILGVKVLQSAQTALEW